MIPSSGMGILTFLYEGSLLSGLNATQSMQVIAEDCVAYRRLATILGPDHVARPLLPSGPGAGSGHNASAQASPVRPGASMDSRVAHQSKAAMGRLRMPAELWAISPTTFTGIATGQYRKRVRGEPAHAPRPSELSEPRGSGRLRARPDRCAGVRVTRVPPGHRHPARVPAVPPPAGRGHSVAGLLLAGCRVEHWTSSWKGRRT